MELSWQIFLTVFGAVFGAMFSFVLPVILNNRRYKKRPELLGIWKSHYRSDFPNDPLGITEDVEIDLRFGRLRMRNRRNPSEDTYEVHAEVVQKIYITGDWFSLKPGANAFGAIILTISPLGNMMYGYFTGMGNTGERTYCEWVLARREQDIGTAFELLRSGSLKLKRKL